MKHVREGAFLMGTSGTIEAPFSLELQYDNTERPQRRVWLDAYEIDHDEVSLAAYVFICLMAEEPGPCPGGSITEPHPAGRRRSWTVA